MKAPDESRRWQRHMARSNSQVEKLEGVPHDQYDARYVVNSSAKKPMPKVHVMDKPGRFGSSVFDLRNSKSGANIKAASVMSYKGSHKDGAASISMSINNLNTSAEVSINVNEGPRVRRENESGLSPLRYEQRR